MDKEKFIAWIKATAIRVIRTMAQVALGYLTVGLTIHEVKWLEMLSVVAVAGLYSLLTNVLSQPPETKLDENDGEVFISPDGEYIGNLTIFANSQEEIMNKDILTLKVKKDPDLGSGFEEDKEDKDE